MMPTKVCWGCMNLGIFCTCKKEISISNQLQCEIMRTVRIIGPGIDKNYKARIKEKVLTTTFGTFYLDIKKWIVNDEYSFKYVDGKGQK